jgi:hypothetical protein
MFSTFVFMAAQPYFHVHLKNIQRNQNSEMHFPGELLIKQLDIIYYLLIIVWIAGFGGEAVGGG